MELASESIERALTAYNKCYAIANGIIPEKKPTFTVKPEELGHSLYNWTVTEIYNHLAKRERTIHDPRPHKPYVELAENVRLYAVDYDGDFQSVDVASCELWHGMQQDYMSDEQERDMRLRYESALEKASLAWEVKYANP